MSTNRYGQSDVTRAALAPGLLGGIVLLAGLALIGDAWYTAVLYAASILALILCVFASQAKSWLWLIGLVPIAIIWNPVWPLTIGDTVLRFLHVAGAIVFVAAGIAITVPVREEPNRR